MSTQKWSILENEGPSFSNALYWAENGRMTIFSKVVRTHVLQKFKSQQHRALKLSQFHFMPKDEYVKMTYFQSCFKFHTWIKKSHFSKVIVHECNVLNCSITFVTVVGAIYFMISEDMGMLLFYILCRLMYPLYEVCCSRLCILFADTVILIKKCTYSMGSKYMTKVL